MTGRLDRPVSMPEIVRPVTSHIPDRRERKVHLLRLFHPFLPETVIPEMYLSIQAFKG
jgi:hypothetical protein